MTKQFHYTYEAAMEAAQEFAKNNNGWIRKDEIWADDRSLQGCEYADEKADNLCWSGAVAAIEVDDNDTGAIIGIFAHWE